MREHELQIVPVSCDGFGIVCFRMELVMLLCYAYVGGSLCFVASCSRSYILDIRYTGWQLYSPPYTQQPSECTCILFAVSVLCSLAAFVRMALEIHDEERQ